MKSRKFVNTDLKLKRLFFAVFCLFVVVCFVYVFVFYRLRAFNMRLSFLSLQVGRVGLIGETSTRS